jgi:ribonuclease E
MKKEMLINVLQPEECRIAIIEDGVLEELYVERTSQESYVGNIYKGRIVNIEPSIQAAFVDFGIGRNGFLHVSDVEPAYYRHLENGGGDRRGGRGRPPRGRGDRRREPERDRAPVDFGEGEMEGDAGGGNAREQSTESNDRGRPPRGRGRGRGRGRSREREQRNIVESPEPDFLPEPESLPPQDDSLSFPPPGDDEGPSTAFMDSAERRTAEGDEPLGPLEPSGISDDDLFFPRSQLSGKPASPPPPPPPVPEVIQEEEESDYMNVPPVEPTPEMVAEAHEEWDMADSEVVVEDVDRLAIDEAEDFEQPLEDFEADERPRSRRPPRGDRRERGGRRPMSGRPGFGRPKPLIQDIFRRGQEVLVQVIKEGIGTKGPTLSTYISIAGRYLVLMPGLNRVGVSRKIADDDQRRRLREIFHELQPPKGLGFIIRTAGLDKTKKELQRDLAYLSRLWQVVVRRIKKLKSPCEIYQESDMITRTIRDTFTNDIDTIWVDEAAAFEHAQEFLTIVMPRYASRIRHFADSEPLFHRYRIEEEIARIQQRHVPLPNGGSIVIDQTEALVAIDVNSGNFRADNNAEETAFQMNLHAAREIARQLRLRDLGGVIVNDFIDMRDEKHRREVERALRDAVKRDRARTKILKISAFGLIEMTRQRIRPSLKRSVYQDCPHCHGTSQVKTTESMSIDVMRMIQLAAHRENIHRIHIRVQEDVANYLLNRKRKEISRLEEGGELQVTINGVLAGPPELLEFTCYDNNNNEVKFLTHEDHRQRRR